MPSSPQHVHNYCFIMLHILPQTIPLHEIQVLASHSFNMSQWYLYYVCLAPNLDLGPNQRCTCYRKCCRRRTLLPPFISRAIYLCNGLPSPWTIVAAAVSYITFGQQHVLTDLLRTSRDVSASTLQHNLRE